LQTKRIDSGRYEIVPPDEALAGLNADIYEQNLSSCQFCTAVYGIINTETLLLRYARGGHPFPLLLDANGAVQQLDAVGSLLGIFPEETFNQKEIHLHPGNRLVIFSDGAEDILSDHPSSGNSTLVSTLQSLRNLRPDEMSLHLARRIDEYRRTGQKDDDVTVLVMDIIGSQPE
ncbi:MAG: serine/threonine-protein phosphatase, partial [Phycisphaerae bacterium]|nr:serine/threonine-protein phosphatase [Phycisphaerae bacterium]